MGLFDALKNGKFEYTGKRAQDVKIKLGDGDANISVRADKTKIETGVGNQTVAVLGNDVDIELDKNAPLDWDSSKDNDLVAVTTDNGKTGKIKIDTGDGNDMALAVGKNIDVKMGDGDHVVSFWGNNKVNVEVGNGNNNITTMDKFVIDGNLDEKTSVLGIEIGAKAEEAIEASTIKKSEVLWDTTSRVAEKSDFLNKMKQTYNLDDENMKMLEKLYDSGELMDELSPGVPKYGIMESIKQKNPDGSTKYVLCKYDKGGTEDGGYIHSRGYMDGSFKECIATKQYTKSSFTEGGNIIHEVATRDYWDISGAKTVNVKAGNGVENYINLTSTGTVNIEAGDFHAKLKKGQTVNGSGGGHTINIDEGRLYDDIKIHRDVTTTPIRTIRFGTNLAATYTSPLVVDFNKDGQVSAASGNGVDVNGDGIGDGYATNGDKMLAMSDINKTGTIDGSEVFGDQTVSPFTGQKLNSANGFEALRMIAEEAEKYTGTSCIQNGVVNLQQLKAALNTVGVDLGFISDNNITELEDLAHVQAINVAEYDEVDAEGNVQHRQLGSYIDTNGESYGTNDVWFKNRTNIDNMIDRLK